MRSVAQSFKRYLSRKEKATGSKHAVGGLVLVAALSVGLALPAGAQAPVVEAVNGDGETILQVNEDGGLLGLGTFGTGVIPAEGLGTRLMWYPARGAFRAGSVNDFSLNEGADWNDVNVGTHSTAFGVNVIAQEVEAVFPELVNRGADGYLSVAYPKLAAVLLQGLHEQQAEIDAQQEEMNTLRMQNATFQEQMLSMQQRLARLEAQFERLALAGGVAAATANRVIPLSR